jgi:hypothetical protein
MNQLKNRKIWSKFLMVMENFGGLVLRLQTILQIVRQIWRHRRGAGV